MEIIGHFIADNEIIGISPVYDQATTDQATLHLYNAQRVVFYVHCKSRDIEIQSNYFYIGRGKPEDLNKEEKQGRLKRSNFIIQYEFVKQSIIEKINS